MLKQETTAPIVNNSSEVAQPKDAKLILEILPKIEKIGMDLECKIDNLTQTKNHLFSLLSETVEQLADGCPKSSLFAIIWQIQTIDECIQESMTTDDFLNLENFIYYTKCLLTPKTA